MKPVIFMELLGKNFEKMLKVYKIRILNIVESF